MTQPFNAVPAWPLQAIGHLLPDTGIWLAGGAVRDLLLHRVPHDWDLVLAGSGLGIAREVANALGGAYYALDRERGTGRAIVTHPTSGTSATIDFATMRGADIEEDLGARDFTINAMALTRGGCLVDPTGGQTDLATARLRMVSPTCFRDDPVRLLRAIRLSMLLALEIERETARHIGTEAESILDVAPERIRTELMTLLSLPTAPEGVRWLQAFGLLTRVLPEAVVSEGADSVPAAGTLEQVLRIDHAADGCGAGPLQGCVGPRETPAPALRREHRSHLEPYLTHPVGSETTRADLLRWAALFCDAAAIGSGTTKAGTEAARLAEHRMEELRFSRNEIAFVRLTLIGQDGFQALLSADTTGSERLSSALAQPGRAISPEPPDYPDALTRRMVFRYFRTTRDAGVAAALLFIARAAARPRTPAAPETASGAIAVATTLMEAYFHCRDEIVDPPLLLSGDDVMALGVPQGPAVGRLIATLREAQAAGDVSSTADATALIRGVISGSVPAEGSREN